MKNIVDIMPDAVETVLYELNKEDYIEAPEIYYYFRDEIFFKELEEFVERNYSRRKGRLKTYEDKEKEIRKGNTLRSPDASKDVIEFELSLDNYKIMAKYVKDFDAQRQRVYLYESKFYTYTIKGNITYPIIVHQFENEDILNHLNIYAYMRNRSFFRYILDKLKGSY